MQDVKFVLFVFIVYSHSNLPTLIQCNEYVWSGANRATAAVNDR